MVPGYACEHIYIDLELPVAACTIVRYANNGVGGHTGKSNLFKLYENEWMDVQVRMRDTLGKLDVPLFVPSNV